MQTGDDFEAQLEALVGGFLSDGGCPCRFPRFRATVRRDTSRACDGNFTTIEQRRLIFLYEQKVPLRDKRDVEFGWQAICARCGSTARYGANEFRYGGWIDYLTITKPPEVKDIGAPVGAIVYRASGWISASGETSGMDAASRTYPLMPREDWLRWMRERPAITAP